MRVIDEPQRHTGGGGEKGGPPKTLGGGPLSPRPPSSSVICLRNYHVYNQETSFPADILTKCGRNACIAIPGIHATGHDRLWRNQLRHAVGVCVHPTWRDHGQVDPENGGSGFRVHTHSS